VNKEKKQIDATGIPLPDERDGGRMVIEIERTIRVRRIPGGFVPRRDVVRDILTALKLTGNKNKKLSGRSES
jgi:hypothetical protein